MKKLTIFNIVLLSLMLAQPGLSVEERPHDGYWWECVGFEKTQLGTTCKLLQLAYVSGYADSLSIIVSQVRVEQHSLELNIKEIKNEQDRQAIGLTFALHFDSILGKDIMNITYGQLQDGLTKFYSDFRNKRIDLDSALSIVKMQVEGEKKSYIDCMEEFVRLQQQGKFDDASKRAVQCEKIRLTR